MIYQWKAGSHVTVDAQIAGEELERIRTFHNGRLEGDMVVEQSRQPDAPLHAAFDWDDQSAAHKHRVEQAKYLIRSIELVIERPEAAPKPIRAFVSVQREDDRSYTSTLHALADPVLRAQVVEAAWRELEAWHRRHAELLEFGRIFAEIERVRAAKP